MEEKIKTGVTEAEEEPAAAEPDEKEKSKKRPGDVERPPEGASATGWIFLPRKRDNHWV